MISTVIHGFSRFSLGVSRVITVCHELSRVILAFSRVITTYIELSSRILIIITYLSSAGHGNTVMLGFFQLFFSSRSQHNVVLGISQYFLSFPQFLHTATTTLQIFLPAGSRICLWRHAFDLIYGIRRMGRNRGSCSDRTMDKTRIPFPNGKNQKASTRG